jgi:formylglycine-generating enzyme required for sulfatase activity
MKTTLRLTMVAFGLAIFNTSAQTPAGIGLRLYGGLSITGAVGTVYSIDYITDLTQSNTPSAWRCLEFLQLPADPFLWIDKSAPATGIRFYRAGVFAAPTNMVFIPPGTFRMGSPTNEAGRIGREGPQRAVTISRGFWMGKCEVTQGEYQAVVGSNPSWFNGHIFGGVDYGTDLSRPVENVTWDDATNYCDQLTQRERAAGRIGTNSVYRLPTEAEWEYACRGWTSTRFSYGDDQDYTTLTNYAWYGNINGTTHPVGQKAANPWGLYDIHGNVQEWCQDWWGDYPSGPAVDPQGPETGTLRVIRSGYWYNLDRWCRSASRSYSTPTTTEYSIGFRVVLAPGQP